MVSLGTTQDSQDEVETSEEEVEMLLYGITRVSNTYYHVGKYRYTTLDDAVAQAKRMGRPQS
jgi:hypothetical protein